MGLVPWSVIQLAAHSLLLADDDVVVWCSGGGGDGGIQTVLMVEMQ